MQQAKILVIDSGGTRGLRSSLKAGLLQSGLAAVPIDYQSFDLSGLDSSHFETSPVSLSRLPDLIFLILPSNPTPNLGPFLQELKVRAPNAPVLVVADFCGQDRMMSLFKWGAADFLIAPFKEQDLISRLERWGRPGNDREKLVQNLKEKVGLRTLVGESPAFLSEIGKIPLMAKSDAGVLISGETGTGKELCARAIHYLSPRADRPFVPVNCGAIPAELMENELFGHVAGAFTGAAGSKPGLIEEADRGTVFLDEIDCLSPAAQVKLLRLLQEKEYRQLGSTRICRADVRVIAATNLDIPEAVGSGRIRRDLYYRLDVIPLALPALRERRDDIPLLADHFLNHYSRELQKQILCFHPLALQKLLAHDWPGNVRELEHVIQRAALFCEQNAVGADEIRFPRLSGSGRQETFKEAKAKIIDCFERTYIQGLLRVYQGNISQASKAARKNRRAFWQLIRKHRIDAQSFKTGQ